MMKRMSSRSGLFLLELVISILFFSVASAVCIRLFVQAHFMDKDNKNLTNAVQVCENFAEVYTSLHGDITLLSSVYPNADITQTTDGVYTLLLYFDEDGNICTAFHAECVLAVAFFEEAKDAGTMYTAYLRVFPKRDDQENLLYELPVSVYVSNRGGAFE